MKLEPQGAIVPSLFDFSYGAMLDDGSIYVVGIALELERKDVPHAIIWERIRGEWKRYQWKNRVYGLAAYFDEEGIGVAAYLGYEGTIKVRSAARGSSEEVVETGNEGPSSLRTVSCIRVVGDCLLVAGMRRMVYRRSLNENTWSRIDHDLRLSKAELNLAGLYAIDGTRSDSLCAVGIGGEVWSFDRKGWCRLDSPTNTVWLAVRHLSDNRYLLGGEMGGLWLLDGNQWREVEHAFPSESFTCIEYWSGRIFVSADSGAVFELIQGDPPSLVPVQVPGIFRVSSMFANSQQVLFCGETRLACLDEAGWHDCSPPVSLVA